ncbi:hypothetical protein HFN59_24080 [Rhizobium leguminosarum]|nr:hypothetical protein [Rhizobium leguminosarum]
MTVGEFRLYWPTRRRPHIGRRPPIPKTKQTARRIVGELALREVTGRGGFGHGDNLFDLSL